jgi:hypothetical protein
VKQFDAILRWKGSPASPTNDSTSHGHSIDDNDRKVQQLKVRGELEVATKQRDVARESLAHVERLVANGFASPVELDKARYDLAVVEVRMNALNEQWKKLNASNASSGSETATKP